MEAQQKNPVKSKTLWFNGLLLLIGAISTQFRDLLHQHPEEVLACATLINALLRFLTRTAVR